MTLAKKMIRLYLRPGISQPAARPLCMSENMTNNDNNMIPRNMTYSGTMKPMVAVMLDQPPCPAMLGHHTPVAFEGNHVRSAVNP